MVDCFSVKGGTCEATEGLEGGGIGKWIGFDMAEDRQRASLEVRDLSALKPSAFTSKGPCLRGYPHRPQILEKDRGGGELNCKFQICGRKVEIYVEFMARFFFHAFSVKNTFRCKAPN